MYRYNPAIIARAGLSYINPEMFHDHFAQDVKQPEADIMVVAQKPFNLSNFDEKSGRQLGSSCQHGIRFLLVTL